MKKIKIGILIRKFNNLQNWELRIIEGIRNDPSLELTLLIEDLRFEENNNKLNIKTLSEFIFKNQVSFEKKRYLNNLQTVNKVEIINFLNTIPVLEVEPKHDENIDIFSKEDSQKVKSYDLDIILKHGFNSISGDILNSAKHGIWLLIHGRNSDRFGSPGLCEVVTKQPVVEVKLLQLTEDHEKGLFIDQAFYNRHKFSYVETNTKVLESSVTLLFKNLRRVINGYNSIQKYLVNFYSYNINETPDLKNTLKYSGNYIKGLFHGFLEKSFGLFGKRFNHWTIFIGKGNFMESDLSKLKPFKVPNDEFWADPFLIKYKEQYFVYFENYSYKTKRGKISCGKVKNNELIDVVDILDLEYHLSYPFIFEEDGSIFLMPETGQNKRLEIYKCLEFPDKWELYTTAFEGENVADAFFYKDQQKQKWLFLNKVIAQNTDRTSDLYIYKVDSLKLNTLIPHKQNPVIIDARVARNGGAIFEYQDKIFRPSQSNTDGIYGKTLNINEIEKLTIDKYVEKTIKNVKPNFQKKLVSIHHLNQIDGMFVFDAAFHH